MTGATYYSKPILSNAYTSGKTPDHDRQRAGRLIRPQGQLTLSMSANPTVQEELLHYLDALQAA